MTSDATTPDVLIRDARDADGEDLIALIEACWADYPGCVLDVDGELPELKAIASHHAARGGRFWVVPSGGRVIASVGMAPAVAGSGIELHKLYVHPTVQRRGLGERLALMVEDEARRMGAGFIELWSDTRFTRAHRLYERLGYRRGPRTRALHDLSNSVEYCYRKMLTSE